METTKPMASMAFAGVKCLACQSEQVVSLAFAGKLPRVCDCHREEAGLDRLDVERARVTIEPDASSSSIAFEMVFANAAYVAALFGVVVFSA